MSETNDLKEKYKEVSAAMLADSLDAVGWRRQVLSAGICPLQSDVRILGRAATVQFAPTELDTDDPYGDIISFLDALSPGDVAIVATSGDLRAAYWGELFSAAAIHAGAVGVITDGCLRDTAKIQALGFAAFCSASRPIDYRARMRVVASNTPVTCGGVLISPGDLVLADDDGVVVAPRSVETEALALAVARSKKERLLRDQLLAGNGLRTAWERFGVL